MKGDGGGRGLDGQRRREGLRSPNVFEFAPNHLSSISSTTSSSSLLAWLLTPHNFTFSDHHHRIAFYRRRRRRRIVFGRLVIVSPLFLWLGSSLELNWTRESSRETPKICAASLSSSVHCVFGGSRGEGGRGNWYIFIYIYIEIDRNKCVKMWRWIMVRRAECGGMCEWVSRMNGWNESEWGGVCGVNVWYG